jgi:hypothetical protein
MTRRNPRHEAEDRRVAQVLRQRAIAERMAAAESQAEPAPANFSTYADVCRGAAAGRCGLDPEPEAG